jgi:hypothetical protein
MKLGETNNCSGIDLEGQPTDGNFDMTYHRGAAQRKQYTKCSSL